MKAVHIIADSNGMGVPLRRVTISTAGIVPKIRAHDSWRDPVLLEQWSLVHGLATLAMEGQFGPNPRGSHLMKAIRSALELGAVPVSNAEKAPV